MAHQTYEEMLEDYNKRKKALEEYKERIDKKFEGSSKTLEMYKQGRSVSFIARETKMKEESVRITLYKEMPYEYFRRGDVTLKELRVHARNSRIHFDVIFSGMAMSDIAAKFNLSESSIDEIAQNVGRWNTVWSKQAPEPECFAPPSHSIFHGDFEFGEGISDDKRYMLTLAQSLVHQD